LIGKTAVKKIFDNSEITVEKLRKNNKNILFLLYYYVLINNDFSIVSDRSIDAILVIESYIYWLHYF